MSLFVLAIFIIIIGLVNDKIGQSDPYYGTSRDIHRNNPDVLRNRERCKEIYKKYNK